jgi:hypothetical protein
VRGRRYGLALFRCGEFEHIVVPGTGDPAGAVLWGHPGSDYGSSSSPVCGWNDAYGFGICVLMNSVQGMNCSSEASVELAQRAPSIGSCLIYAEILKLHGGPWLNCYDYEPDAARVHRPHRRPPRRAPRCAWEDGLSVCGGCRSSVCAQCADCTKDRVGECAPCWEGFFPCMPMCHARKCF